MTNLRKRLTFVSICLAAASAATGALIACSSEDTVVNPDGGTGEAGTVDSPTGGETGTDSGGTDAGTDSFVPVEAGSLADFVKLNGETTCTRLAECCGAKFDKAKCNTDFASGGWANSTRDLSVTGVATGGKVTYDPAAGTECVTAIRNLTCKNTPIAEYKNANEKCFAAAKGTLAVGVACLSNAECVPTAYCDVGTNQCTALKGAGETCNPTLGECTYRQATGASRCLDPGTGTTVCGGQIANGQPCGYSDFDCQSGSCYSDLDAGTASCENKVGFIDEACAYYVVDGG